MIGIRTKVRGLRRLKRKHAEMRRALLPAMDACMILAQREAREKHLSGPRPAKLQRRSGRLRGSVTPASSISGNRIRGQIGSNVVYARIHEMGGEIRPRNARALKFRVNGRWVSTQLVRMPARPFLRPALEENLGRFKTIFKDAIVKAFDR